MKKLSSPALILWEAVKPAELALGPLSIDRVAEALIAAISICE